MNNLSMSHPINRRIHVRKFSPHYTNSYVGICQSYQKYTMSFFRIEKNSMAYLYFMELKLLVDKKKVDFK